MNVTAYMTVRLGVFMALLLALSLLETLIPYRTRELSRKQRWPGHLGLILTSSLLAKLLFPLGLTFFSFTALEHQWGLLPKLSLSHGTTFFLSLVILDGAIYFSHVWSHKIPLLWRLHRVHHTDTDLDATSALRFHPLEILLSLLYKAVIIVLFGITAEAVLVFEIILNGCALFNHANISIPQPLEKVLRLFIVTPQMHLVHHSVRREESDRNFGFNLSLWDYVFRTYTQDFARAPTIGQRDCRTDKDQRLLSLLLQPFR